MPLNHTFTITMCNTKLVLKLGLLILILALLVFAILYAASRRPRFPDHPPE